MHDYAIDRHPKEKVLFLLAFLAIFVTPHVNRAVFFAATSMGFSSEWITALGTVVPLFALFSALYYSFDRFLWKLPLLRKLLLVPDLNGNWHCEGKTVLKEGEPTDFEWAAMISITQSWSKISIRFRTTQSSSLSTSASIYHDVGIGFRLLYQYRNEPQANEINLSNHAGSAEIRFSEDCTVADGNYYTDRHRSTVGIITLRRAHDDTT